MISVAFFGIQKHTTKITFSRHCERVIFYVGKGMLIGVQAGLCAAVTE